MAKAKRQKEKILVNLAVGVLGWDAGKWLDDGCGPSDGKTYPFLCPWGETDDGLLVFPAKRSSGYFFNPYENASHDYLLLVAARKKDVDTNTYLDFARALTSLWKRRQPGIVYAALVYKPGDYALAASRSLLAAGKVTN